MSLEDPPGCLILMGVIWRVLRILSVSPSPRLRVVIMDIMASFCFIVHLMSHTTSGACISWYVRFSIAQIKDEAGSEMGITKNVIRQGPAFLL